MGFNFHEHELNFLFAARASEDTSEPYGSDDLMDIQTKDATGKCVTIEGEECDPGSKANDPCCYLDRKGKQHPGICTRSSYLEVIETDGRSIAGVLLGCFSKKIATRLDFEALKGLESATTGRASKECATHEGSACYPGSKMGDKCCFLTGTKKNHGLCVKTAFITVVENGGRSMAGEVNNCFSAKLAGE